MQGFTSARTGIREYERRVPEGADATRRRRVAEPTGTSTSSSTSVNTTGIHAAKGRLEHVRTWGVVIAVAALFEQPPVW